MMKNAYTMKMFKYLISENWCAVCVCVCVRWKKNTKINVWTHENWHDMENRNFTTEWFIVGKCVNVSMSRWLATQQFRACEYKKKRRKIETKWCTNFNEFLNHFGIMMFASFWIPEKLDRIYPEVLNCENKISENEKCVWEWGREYVCVVERPGDKDKVM